MGNKCKFALDNAYWTMPFVALVNILIFILFFIDTFGQC